MVGRVGVDTGMEVVGNVGVFLQQGLSKGSYLGGLEREGNFLGDSLVRCRVDVGILGG